jgi:alkylation response protein AidB-like acyl-CoA dehydrogenase
MNFGFTEDQDMIRRSARDFVKGESSLERVRAMHEDARGYSQDVYRRMAESGWLGAVLPEDYGGIGLGMCDLICITEELGKGLLPEPLIPSAIFAGSAILLSGDEPHRQELLPKVASGELTLSLGAYELDGRFAVNHVATRAEHRREGFVLTGTKCLVDNAGTADRLLVTARTSGTTRETEGISLFLVDPRSQGVTITPVSTVDRRKRANVTLESVEVPASALVGPEGGALTIVEDAIDRAIVALCAEMVGGMEEALRRTCEYAQERVQFGRAIGSFQAVKHKAANMYVALETARSSMYYAAMALDQDMPDAKAAVSAAKALCSRNYLHAAKEAIQLHGGIGFTAEHDIHLFYKRAVVTNVLYGDPAYHRERYVTEKRLDADPVAEVLAGEVGTPALQK